MKGVLATSRLVIFCGKGGVGKTTVALAAGLKHARAGRKVLVVSSHPLAELALAVSLEGLGVKYPEAARNLFVVHIDPKELITDLVNKHFPVPAMATRILNSKIFTNLIKVAPGLKEFFFLGRMQELAERKNTDATAPAYEYLIWDAPASGHFLSTLRAAKSFELFLSGPLSAAGAQLHRFFSNRRNIQVVPVTPLEEMAIAETLELTQSVRKEFEVQCCTVIVNCASPVCTASDEDLAVLVALPEKSEAMRFAVNRGLQERERLADLTTSLPSKQVLIPRITHWTNDLELLAKVGERLDMAQFA